MRSPFNQKQLFIMAEMGLGYGSEFQLMRFLGHHREELDKLIQEASGRSEQVYWFDFPYDENKLSGDGECKGIECFKELDNYDTIKKKWVEFWPQRGTAMNWDGIFKIGDTWFFVEAKAHKEESFQWCSAEAEESRETINTAFSKTQQWLKADTSKDWIITNCYQLANRLAFMYFCHQCGIEAKLLYIGFINGYRQKKDEIHSVEEWEEVWTEEMSTLGLNKEIMAQCIYFIYPNCEPDR